MVLNRVWTINKRKDYIRVFPFKEHKYSFVFTEPGTYHFVCGLPVELNVNKAFRVTDERTKLQHRINKAAAEKSKYLLKVKIRVFNKYQPILKEKTYISLKGDKIEGKAHYHFVIKKSHLNQPVHMHFRIMSMGIIKRLRVHAALYKDMTPEEDDRRLMRAYLKHIFEPESIEPSENNVFTIDTEDIEDTDVFLQNQDSIGSNHIVTSEEVGSILRTELFEQPKFGSDSNRSRIDLSDTQAYKQHVRKRTMSEIQQTLMKSMKSKYPKVKYTLVENPFKQDSLHPTEKESTLLSEIQIQLLHYEVVPKKYRMRTWKQRFNSKIFGHNMNEIIRLCSTSPEPQLLIIQDDNDFVFGGFLCNGLYLKNRYNKEAAVNFPSIYHNTFNLSNYDIPRSYYEVQDESESSVFTFHKSKEHLLRYNYKLSPSNRMFRVVNDKKGIAMGGPKFAFLVDSSIQHGASGASETYGNCILASSETFNIQAFEVWGLQKGSIFNR